MREPRRRTQTVEKLAQDLLGCSSFQADCPPPAKIVRENVPDRHAKRLERLSQEDENKNQYKPGNREEGAYTKRPQVDKLNPELLFKVEKIVTGDLIKEKEKLLYDEKAGKKTLKMSRQELEAMQKKLIDTGMQINRPENVTSQEEKIMKIVVNDARKEAESGFSRTIETERFKHYDEAIKKSEEVLKMKDIAGIDPFNRWKEVPKKNLENQENNGMIRVSDVVGS